MMVTTQAIVPKENNSMLLGAVMLRMLILGTMMMRMLMLLMMMPIFIYQVIVPDEKNSMLLGAAMLGMAAGEEEGLKAVVRKLQKISKVTNLKNTDNDQRKIDMIWKRQLSLWRGPLDQPRCPLYLFSV